MATSTARTEIKKQIMRRLGNSMTDVELDPEDLDLAIDFAIDRYRQRAENACMESMLFITLQRDETEYTLPTEVQEVRRLYRRSVGSGTSGGTNFDPFESAFSNIFFLQAGRTGGLATWHLFSEYQETLGRIFGSEINFTWNYADRKLTIMRKFQGAETVLVVVWVAKSEDVLLTDVYSRPWLRDYAIAQSKYMLGEARSKFTNGLPGPNGSVTLNGDQLKQEAFAEMERLENEIINYTTGTSFGMPFIIG
ncbi:hypothetical protein RVBP17_1030 [Pseudomonas phage sp. 30-3]|uniref:Neck protein n=1 Tax=Pseudomonas phage vB_PaeM_PA5oct TaxID=2163605 RepID=A0A4Y1LUJ4_9CAUD|nr:head-tail adaptor Ad2 [Pseudomonas phage vB_PaeM_PA5oct]WMI31737.1 hypothetical protein GBBBJNDB_00034 [Pseudomonas phage Callisto]WPK39187.1 head-tail adaptor [Pseudomonas phage Cassandra]WPK39699.1 head-tail adaptor [Pseudomonas phage Deifobo]WPK40220.1 head-tail adaptor [Pseudomonas phage Ettore]WPK40735.1 head-tail adaptor [Pseudomonas phage Paride]VOH53645.1 Possible phage neck protein [Pseudomonas phage vB_PaeM_MIJ3]BDR25854.1 hypothetical protein RVBP16_2940 [Pseudomonas phage sp. 